MKPRCECADNGNSFFFFNLTKSHLRKTNLSAGEQTRVRVPAGDKKHLSICVIACQVRLRTFINNNLVLPMIVLWVQIFICFAAVRKSNMIILVTLMTRRGKPIDDYDDYHSFLMLIKIAPITNRCHHQD